MGRLCSYFEWFISNIFALARLECWKKLYIFNGNGLTSSRDRSAMEFIAFLIKRGLLWRKDSRFLSFRVVIIPRGAMFIGQQTGSRKRLLLKKNKNQKMYQVCLFPFIIYIYRVDMFHFYSFYILGKINEYLFIFSTPVYHVGFVPLKCCERGIISKVLKLQL